MKPRCRPCHRTFAAILLRIGLAALAGGCQSDEASPGGRVCAGCEPHVGGDTGDFGGSFTQCVGFSKAAPIDAAAATAVGFDVGELERRATRPIDMPMRWNAADTRGGGPATGYDPDTRIVARISSTGVLHHVRPDPAFCNGTSCQTEGSDPVPQATCPHRLELGVRAEVKTLDGALQASLEGVAVQVLEGASPPEAPFFREPYFVTHTDLSAVTGGLRLAPDPFAFRYKTLLIFEARLFPDGCEGELGPNVLVEDTEWSGTLYHPVYGAFPPPAVRSPQSDAGAPRASSFGSR